MKHQEKLTKETFTPEAFTFVDLGLPSGRLWATENAPGHYTFNEAVKTFGELLPKGSAMVELIEECKCTWNKKNKGLDITGPNGNSIFLPAAGFTSGSSVVRVNEEEGDYWTRMPYSRILARYLCFYRGGVLPLSNDKHSYGHSVRPCQESDKNNLAYLEKPKEQEPVKLNDDTEVGLDRALQIVKDARGNLSGYQTDDGVYECDHAIQTLERILKNGIEQQPAMIQWTGSNLKEVIDFTGKSPKFNEWFKSWDEVESYVHSHGDILKLFSEDGSHFEVPVGAWIVKTPNGYNVPSVARFIHAKQEQPEVDLEKEANECWDYVFSAIGWDENSLMTMNHKEFLAFARHFCELGLNARKE